MNSFGSGSGTGKGPPPVPPDAKGKTPFPALRAPPPIPEKIDGGEQAETTNPSIRTIESQKAMFLSVLKAFYPDDLRTSRNGNGKPVLQMHLQQARDETLMRVESETRYFFLVRSKWVALVATAIALAAGGLAIHSCGENKKLEQRIEQLENSNKELQDLKSKIEQVEKAKPAPVQNKAEFGPTSFYIPKALRNPPQVPNRIPQRVARNSPRA